MKVNIKSTDYEVILWNPVLDVPHSTWIACDTETEEIINGAPVVPVIVQIFDPTKNVVYIIKARDMPVYIEKMHKESPNTRWIFHTASFDLIVLDWLNNMFKDLVEKGMITDIYLRAILSDLERGTFKLGRYGLDKLAFFKLGISMDKDKAIRCTFKLNEKLSEEHLKYAAIDAIVTGLLYLKYPRKMPTEDLQLKGSLVLRDISNNGLLVDNKKFEILFEKYDVLAKEAANTLALFGWRKGVPGNSKIWQSILANLEERCNIKFPRTEKTKQIQLSEDVLEIMESSNRLPPVLRAYKDLTHYNKMLSTYLNTAHIGVDNRIHSYFTPLVSSGRTSSSKPNVQNFPRSGGLREYIIAPPKHVLVSCDYNQLELCVLAQSCLSRFSKSVMADLINAGRDLHMYMGEHIAKSEGKLKLSKKEKKQYRSLAKVPNFGFPGGLGNVSLMSFAKNNYNIVISKDEAIRLKQLWLEIYPEMKEHLKGEVDIKYSAQNFKETVKILYPNSSLSTTEELLYKLREDGLSESEIFPIRSKLCRFKYTTLSGRTKSNCSFNAAANGRFQPDAADGAKKALWNVYKAGFKIVNFIHDEIIVELKIDKYLQDSVSYLKEIMETSMQELITDVKITAEPAASVRWYKAAEPVYNSEGIFTIWHPDIFTPKEFVKDIREGNVEILQNKCIEKNLNILYEDPNQQTIYGFEEKGINPINWW